MGSNIKTIKFTAAVSILFALLTYIITLNIELSFFSPNWPWASNNFALTVCSGVFASMLVVTLCEVQKYLENKDSCEQNMFYQTMYLYQILFLIQKNVEEYIENQVQVVPDNLLDDYTQMAQCQINAIRSLNYVPFSKKNSLMIAHRNFCAEKLATFDSILGWKNYLKMALLRTRISNLEKSGKEGFVTSADSLVGQTLGIIDEKCQLLLDCLSDYLSVIDKACSGRFRWREQKERIGQSYISILNAKSLEDFLTQGNTLPSNMTMR